MKHRLTISLALAAVSLALASPAQAQGTTYWLNHFNENHDIMCIYQRDYAALGSLIEPRVCDPNNGGWSLEKVVDKGSVKGLPGLWPLYRIRDIYNVCIGSTNAGASIPEGTLAAMAGCGTQAGVLWTFGNTLEDGISFINATNGKCLQSYGWLGTALVLHTCDANYGGQHFNRATRVPF